MTFHLLAYEEAIGQTADTDMDAISDDIVVRQNSHFLLQDDQDLIFAGHCGATATRARIVTPSMRQITPTQIRPVAAAANFASDPNIMDLRKTPLRLRGLEEIAVEATSAIAMSTEQHFSVLGVTKGLQSAPRGDVYSFRGSSTTAAVALAWTTIAMSWVDSLPQGVYSIVGMECEAATNIAARLILENQVQRPGCISTIAAGNRSHAMFRHGGLGEFGRFRSTSLPQVQVLNVTTVSAFAIYLDIVRLSA